MSATKESFIILAAWQPISRSLTALITSWLLQNDNCSSSSNNSKTLIVATISGEEVEYKSFESRINEILPPEILVDIKHEKEVVSQLLSKHAITMLPCIVAVDTSEDVRKDYLKQDAHVSPTDTDSISNGETGSGARLSFSKAVEDYDQFDFPAAAEGFYRALEIDPAYKSALFNLAGLLHMVGYPTLAVHYIKELLVIEPEDMTSHSFLWALTQSPDAAEAGIDAYRHLALTGDVKAAAKLAALTGEGSLASKGDAKYAQRIYDDMAEKFETKLVSHLGYRGPWDMEDMISERIRETTTATTHSKQPQEQPQVQSSQSSIFEREGETLSSGAGGATSTTMGDWRALDLGCGSGLVGRVFSEYTGRGHPGKIGESDSEAIGSADTVLVSSESDPANTQNVLRQLYFQPGPVMIGVDVSLRMTEITARTRYYDAAVHSDLSTSLDTLCEFTKKTPDVEDEFVEVQHDELKFDLVVAADTFIYVGVLGGIFSLVKHVLKRGGLFVFSVEDLDASPMRVRVDTSLKPPTSSPAATVPHTTPSSKVSSSSSVAAATALSPKDTVTESDEQKEGKLEFQGEFVDGEPVGAVPGWGAQLLKSARFAHSDEYIRVLASYHGFTVAATKVSTLRTEETIPLQGRFYVLENNV